MKRFYQRMRGWMEEYAYLIMLSCVIAIVAGCAMYTRQIQNGDDMGVQAAAQAQEIQSLPSPTISPRLTPLPTIAALAVRPAMLTGQPVQPVGGQVIRPFDVQETVFWERLGLWRAHAALDIAGEAGESVLCAADATVTRITCDALWGYRIDTQMADGAKLSYAGLTEVRVQEGMAVRRGEALGILLGSIPCEAELGTHLHLELWREGRAQDPETILPERQMDIAERK